MVTTKPGLAALTAGLLAVTAAADYTPDIIEFTGASDIDFPPHESLTLADGGTIEFWVGADWRNDPGYDPVVVSNVGPEGALYTIGILGSRAGLTLQSGEYIGAVPFDFSDGQMHHVALADFVDDIQVMIDGRVVGQFDTSWPDLPSAGIWIGSADGVNARFTGAVAGLRLWSIALERKTLVQYAQRDVTNADDPHPDLDWLVAVSDFTDGSLQLTDLDTTSAEDADPE